MKNKLLCLSIFLFGTIIFAQNNAKVSSGSVKRIENFQSKFITSRNVDVWLPDGYDGKKKYSVVYMHDGQMLFDSTLCWNKKEWKADEVFSKLIRENKIERCIVVGIWNNGSERISEYFPTKIFNNIDPKISKSLSEKYCNGKGATGDNYLKFLVTELKPYIDKNFSTYDDKEHTTIMGSSMGGLISMYAISEYPDIFCGAVCMSTSWFSFTEPNYEIPTAIFQYLRGNMATPWGHKIYMDYGTGESDKSYELTQSFVDLIAKGKGYNDYNYMSKVYPKAQHNEIAWSERLNVPIEFLLTKTPRQKPSTGKIDFYEDFASRFVTERNVEVWLPDGYSPKKKYAVLYMHDGQMLFDASTTWNKQSWNADEVANKLIKERKVKDFIIVGVWNAGKYRHANYFPQKPFESLSAEQKNFVTKQLQSAGRVNDGFSPNSDNYLKFLVKELKPFIDSNYPVYRDKDHTFISGSSMGGLISMYAICEYPNVFGGAACMSTHWPGIFIKDNNPVPNAFLNYLNSHLPNPKTHKIYFDYGDKTLDAMYQPYQLKADSIMKIKGFNQKSWLTKFFPGDDHSENSWHKRMNIPLEFLLSK